MFALHLIEDVDRQPLLLPHDYNQIRCITCWFELTDTKKIFFPKKKKFDMDCSEDIFWRLLLSVPTHCWVMRLMLGKFHVAKESFQLKSYVSNVVWWHLTPLIRVVSGAGLFGSGSGSGLKLTKISGLIWAGNVLFTLDEQKYNQNNLATSLNFSDQTSLSFFFGAWFGHQISFRVRAEFGIIFSGSGRVRTWSSRPVYNTAFDWYRSL